MMNQREGDSGLIGAEQIVNDDYDSAMDTSIGYDPSIGALIQSKGYGLRREGNVVFLPQSNNALEGWGGGTPKRLDLPS